MASETKPPPFNLDGPYSRTALYTLSLLFATSSYLSLKHTAIYSYYSLGYYDRSPVLLFTIFLFHSFLAAFCYRRPGGYLIDLRRRANGHSKFAKWVADVLLLTEFLFYLRNMEIMDEAPSMVFATVFGAFSIVFLRVVTPGFGHKLPMVALTAAAYISYTIGLMWAMMPSLAILVVAQFYLLQMNDPTFKDPSSGNMVTKTASAKGIEV